MNEPKKTYGDRVALTIWAVLLVYGLPPLWSGGLWPAHVTWIIAALLWAFFLPTIFLEPEIETDLSLENRRLRDREWHRKYDKIMFGTPDKSVVRPGVYYTRQGIEDLMAAGYALRRKAEGSEVSLLKINAEADACQIERLKAKLETESARIWKEASSNIVDSEYISLSRLKLIMADSQ